MTLNTGRNMPQLGIGVFQIAENDTARVVEDALAVGFRLVDGAAAYNNEKGMGDGLQASGLLRSELFVTSKLWNDAQGRDAALKAFDTSMEKLGLDYLDLYLIHWPLPMVDKYVETWKALIELQKDGRVKSIGVANFHEAHLQRLIDETGVTPALNQIETHPSLAQKDMRAVNSRLGIVTQSWTPLGGGDSFQTDAVRGIADRLDATPAQVILRWHLQNGLSVIPKSTHKDRLQENFDALRLQLTPQDMAALDRLDRGHRTGPDPETFSKRTPI